MSKRESATKTDENDILWHSGHYAAIKLEFLENDADLTYETEHQLNHEPIRIDLLVIKKNKDIQIANELGAAFRGYNIMEYKSEEDSLSIDTVFKANAYAMLYKAYADEVDGIKIDDITVTLTRLGYPRNAMKALAEQGYAIEEKNQGIYMVTGRAILPTQIIVISRLKEELHFWITKLRKSITKEQILQVLKKGKELNEKKIDLYIGPLINVLADANRKAMDKIREEEPDMGNYFRELFKDDLEKQWNDGVAKGEEIANIKNIRNLMETTKMNAEAAMNALKIPSNEVPKYLAML
ncbi:MAG: hypothetical protein SO022_11960 [Selenomonadaceae bacterium]|nr:hypothetical protein [Selenomonadaceae bacterium]